MDILSLIVKYGIYTVMAVSVLAAFSVTLLPNLFHAALALALALIGVAGIYLSLQADFLAVVQLLLYVGAVMTLIVFAVMLTSRIGEPSSAPQNNQLVLPALSACIIFFSALYAIIRDTPWPVRTPLNLAVNTEDLGRALMGLYVFPFEVISVVLIAVLVGAAVVARKDRE